MSLVVRNNPQKWANNSSGASGAYTEGVGSPRRPWAASTAAGAANYATGVQLAISGGKFAKGVQKAGDSKWANGARDKGASRFSQGVLGAVQAYQAGFSPFAAALSGITLKPRGPKGTNYDNVKIVGDALRAAATK